MALEGAGTLDTVDAVQFTATGEQNVTATEPPKTLVQRSTPPSPPQAPLLNGHMEGNLLTTTVRDNPDKRRYEVYSDEQLAGFSDYKRESGEIAFTHTEIDEDLSGRGLARKLVADALADSRRRGLAVLPFCPYVRRVIADNPDKYLDLVPMDARAKFRLPLAGDTHHADHDNGPQEHSE